MNILFISEYFYPRLAGGELVSWMILNGLVMKGHKIRVVTGRMPDTAEYENINGIEIFRPFSSYNLTDKKDLASGNAMIKRISFLFRLYSYLNKFLTSYPVDIVYSSGYISALPASWSASKNHIPAVNSIHSLCGKIWFQLTNPFLATFNYLGEIFIIRLGKYDALHCPSAKVAQMIKPHTSAKIFTIPYPLDFDDITRVKEDIDSELIRKNLEIKREEQFLLFVGSLIKVKNIDGLIRALSSLKTNFKLVLIGEGPERQKIENLSNELGLEDRLIMPGQKSHKETLSIIKSCDVFILPSKSETFSNVALEALALGKPVIATRVGILPEIKSENLYLIDSLEEINSLLAKGIAPKENNRALEDYSMDKVISRYLSMFEEVLKVS